MKGYAKTHPSLALIKYWGKADLEENLPATSSLAVGLESFFTETEAEIAKKDKVIINGEVQDESRFANVFQRLRRYLGTKDCFEIVSNNQVPTAAGLASSSSGLSALVASVITIYEKNPNIQTISEIARLGSASAARAVFGGFTTLEAGAAYASPFLDEHHWDDFRIVIVTISASKKAISSRMAMNLAKDTSPYYEQWLSINEEHFTQACKFLEKKDLPSLGREIRLSYMRMFSTMFSSDPPVLYWKPGSVAVLQVLEELRGEGVQVFETMDAGPQVKCFTLEADVERIRTALRKNPLVQGITVSNVAGSPVIGN
jgi:diphosphomevalonate decarboxylase